MPRRLSPAQYDVDRDCDDSDKRHDRNDVTDDPLAVIGDPQNPLGRENFIHPVYMKQGEG